MRTTTTKMLNDSINVCARLRCVCNFDIDWVELVQRIELILVKIPHKMGLRRRHRTMKFISGRKLCTFLCWEAIIFN